MPHYFILAAAGDVSSLVVPLIDTSLGVNTKDGCIGSVNQLLQVSSNLYKPYLSVLLLSDILADTNHTNKLAGRINTWRSIQQHFHRLPVLGVQGELEVGSLRTGADSASLRQRRETIDGG